MLLIEHKIWHGISSEGYRQVFTKINQNYFCQQGNILLDNLRVLDLVRMSRSLVKGHRRGGVCVLRMLLVFISSFHFISFSFYNKSIIFVVPSRVSHGLVVRFLPGKREELSWNLLGTKIMCWFLLCLLFLSSKFFISCRPFILVSQSRRE